MHFYTSININYLPKARVLAKSIRKWIPDARFSLVFSDAWPEELPFSEEPFDDLIPVEELGIPVENLNFWIYEHTVVELCTAVKGQALVKFLEEGSDKVVYLDPDIVVYDTLEGIDALLDTYDVLLTPHQTHPETDMNDIIHNEICSLQHGAYNFGFYAVKRSENGLRFARWWRDRLVHFCYDDIPEGIFTDQKWGDIVPAMFDGVFILREPGYNVSTWNLSNRSVTREPEGRILVNGQPLQFYHFSGFDSGAQAEMLEMYGRGNPVLYQMREWYISRQNEEGQETLGKARSVYNYYDNGEKIEKEERRLLRKRGDLVQYFGGTNPFRVRQERSYYEWYRTEGKNEMTELERIYHSRSWKLAQFLSSVYYTIKRCIPFA